jgi:ABC-type polysaccharide/polyol phosphate transport system ATPase subunit
MENEYHNATIKLSIKGDSEAKEIYEKIKEILYKSDLKYFDHEIQLKGTYSSGFRNRLNEAVS